MDHDGSMMIDHPCKPGAPNSQSSESLHPGMGSGICAQWLFIYVLKSLPEEFALEIGRLHVHEMSSQTRLLLPALSLGGFVHLLFPDSAWQHLWHLSQSSQAAVTKYPRWG